MNVNLRDIWLTPNLISIFRLLLAVPICIIFLNYEELTGGNYFIIGFIFLAFLSDILDGFIARKTNQVSELGKMVDPLADKVLTSIIVIFMWSLNYFSAEFLVVILLRDIIIFVSGVYLSRKLQVVIASDYVGKATVLSIGIYILFKLFTNSSSGVLESVLFWLVISLSVISLINYYIRGIRLLKNNGNL
jgi:CDP-diacylglycerol--glycerol-3-phosphate 3-phosphatidyltransferase